MKWRCQDFSQFILKPSNGDYDLLNPNVMRDGMHDCVAANYRMAKLRNQEI